MDLVLGNPARSICGSHKDAIGRYRQVGWVQEASGCSSIDTKTARKYKAGLPADLQRSTPREASAKSRLQAFDHDAEVPLLSHDWPVRGSAFCYSWSFPDDWK